MKKMKKAKDSSLADLGRVFAEMRRANGFSQLELSKRAGIHPKYLSQIEHGDINLTFKTLEQILGRGYGVSPTELLFGELTKTRKNENANMIALFNQFLQTATKKERGVMLAMLEASTKRGKG